MGSEMCIRDRGNAENQLNEQGIEDMFINGSASVLITYHRLERFQAIDSKLALNLCFEVSLQGQSLPAVSLPRALGSAGKIICP